MVNLWYFRSRKRNVYLSVFQSRWRRTLNLITFQRTEPEQNCRYFAPNVMKYTFKALTKNSPGFVLKGLTDKESVLIEITGWCRTYIEYIYKENIRINKIRMEERCISSNIAPQLITFLKTFVIFNILITQLTTSAFNCYAPYRWTNIFCVKWSHVKRKTSYWAHETLVEINIIGHTVTLEFDNGLESTAANTLFKC